MVKKILRERNVTLSEIEEALKGEEKKRKLSLFQNRMVEYLAKFSKIGSKKSKKLVKQILKLGDITEEEAVQIVTLMPNSREELKTIFYHRKTIIMTDFLDKILRCLREVEAPKEG